MGSVTLNKTTHVLVIDLNIYVNSISTTLASQLFKQFSFNNPVFNSTQVTHFQVYFKYKKNPFMTTPLNNGVIFIN